MAAMPTDILRIALLHLGPRPGDLTFNRALIHRAVAVAARVGAHWAIAPELAVCGYRFAARIGTDWIAPQPDPWLTDLAGTVRQLGLALFLSLPERDATSGRVHNTVFLLGRDGTVTRVHRKCCVIPGAESWATPGEDAEPVTADGLRVGALICADAAAPALARRLQEQGAQLLIAPSAWSPGPHGPAGEWEARSAESGLPVIVCNRTRDEAGLRFSAAESVVVVGGQRRLAARSRTSVVFTFDWDRAAMTLRSDAFQRAAVRTARVTTKGIG